MPFPVLDAHLVHQLIFNIGGRLSPMSIRDQMIRGQMLIDQAHAAGLIASYHASEGPRNLLVIEAGAAGATAAIHAATKYGVTTVLVDKDTVPFQLQMQCRTRWLEPFLYDWPFDHWRAMQTAEDPWRPSSTPWALD